MAASLGARTPKPPKSVSSATAIVIPDFAPDGASLTELTPISRRIQQCFPAFPLLSRRDQRADPEAGVKKSWRGGALGGCEQRQEI